MPNKRYKKRSQQINLKSGGRHNNAKIRKYGIDLEKKIGITYPERIINTLHKMSIK